MAYVFLSYAREDGEVAERLYSDLRAAGASPWMDRHNLIPGEGWRGATLQALRRSSHFLPLLSRNSVAKRGYVQREMREAIDKLKEIPPDQIFIVPIRLDNTESPFAAIQDLHQLDLFPSYDVAFEALKSVLSRSGGLPTTQTGTSQAHDHDAALLAKYRVLFDRAAFQVPCIFESALIEVQQSIDDISAALATGRLYSRNRNLQLEIQPASALQVSATESAISSIRRSLLHLRNPLELLVRTFDVPMSPTSATGFSRLHMEHHLVEAIQSGLSSAALREAFRLMDDVDARRNAIIAAMNRLLVVHGQKLLPHFSLSSEQLRISAELEGGYRWEDYYLRFHDVLTAHLEGRELP